MRSNQLREGFFLFSLGIDLFLVGVMSILCDVKPLWEMVVASVVLTPVAWFVAINWLNVKNGYGLGWPTHSWLVSLLAASSACLVFLSVCHLNILEGGLSVIAMVLMYRLIGKGIFIKGPIDKD